MSAKSNVPWSVKGIDPDARSVAKELARRRGMTLGEFITDMIREKGLDEAEGRQHPQPGEKVVSGVTTEQLRGVVDTLNRLNERLKAAEKHLQVNEAQSREAMGGLNRGLETVFERIKRLERETAGGAEGRGDLAERLDRLEGSTESNSWVKSLVALERALTTLVDQVETAREDTEQRLNRNEDLIADLKERFEAEDEQLRQEVGRLLEAIDSTTERLGATEQQLQEALETARKAAESQDETFIERTSQRLQLLGSEIKRTSDQIRTLESSVGRLSEKIEAGEHRSAEGISRVAQSLETLRREVEEQSLGRDGKGTQSIRSAVEEADRRMSRLHGAFAAVIDRLEGRDTGVEGKGSGRLVTEPLPEEALVDDFEPPHSADEDDEFDRVFADPLQFVQPADDQEQPSRDRGPEVFLEDRGYPDTGFVDGEPDSARFGTSEPVAETAFGHPGYEPFEERDDAWQAHGSGINPFAHEPPGQPRRPADDLDDTDDPETFGERTAAFFDRAFSRPVDNNPSLGWLLIAAVLGAIVLTGIVLIQPDDMQPVIVEPMPEASRAAVPQGGSGAQEPSADALYAEAKSLFATAAGIEDTTAAVAALTRAAEAGSTPAQYDLGELYLSGDGVPENGLLARRWFSEAAEAGHLRAVHRLAYLDINGIGGPVDTFGAVDGFTRAANAGLTAAMYNLGTLYDPANAYLPEGQRDRVQSYVWYRLAAAQGDAKAAEQAAGVAAGLSPAERAEADRMIASWRPQPLPR